ncbi:MAG: LCP family protein [Chloroflexota bacterium]|nr:LCP family protein [Chloroflexota bacterium]
MRTNWLFLIGVGFMVIATAVCSVGSFALARQVAIQIGESGVQGGSLSEIVSAVRGGVIPTAAVAFNVSPIPPTDAPAISLAITATLDTPATALPTTTNGNPRAPTFTPIPTLGGILPTQAARGSSDGGVSAPATALPTLDTGAASGGANTAAIQPTVDPALLSQYAWQDPRRFNVLLLGIDQRRGEQGPFRTDTIIVVSVDPLRQTVGMLSVPRDLYVPIPGFVTDRINNANSIGESNAYPGGGPALVARTLRDNLGINVDQYVLVNFDFFTTAVEIAAPNGVEICPLGTIHDEYYPDGSFGFMTVHFDPGCQQLGAERLLQYARTRHGNSDFDRASRQQEVIQAVREEILSAGGIANFVGQAPRLWDELSDSYQTNIALDDLIRLGVLLQGIPRENITTGVISTNETRFATTPTGDEVLIPNYNAIGALMQRVFNAAPGSGGGVVGETAPEIETENLSLSELRERSEAENARIGIYNDTTIAGLAGQTGDLLSSRQVRIAVVGNMPAPTGGQTLIVNANNKPYTARYLAALLNLPIERITNGVTGTGEDVVVVVGTDIQPLLSGE